MTRHYQPREPDPEDLACPRCGADWITTPSGFATCSMGCSGLLQGYAAQLKRSCGKIKGAPLGDVERAFKALARAT